MHNSHKKQQNTHKNSETKVGNHRNPLPLWQACIYPALGTGDLQCSPGFLPPAAIHRALPWCLSPGTHLSHSHLKHFSTHFQLPSRGKKKQSNRDHHTHLTRGSSHYDPSCAPSWIYHSLDEYFIPHPLTICVVEAKPDHIMIPLVCLWICHSLDEELVPHLLTIRVVQAKPIFIF